MEKKKNLRKGLQDTEERADSREREMDAQEPEICREESGEAEKETGHDRLPAEGETGGGGYVLQDAENPPDPRGQPPDKDGQEAAGAAGSRFTREPLISSTRFRDRQDLLNALLSPGQAYSIAGVEQMIDEYRKGKVK